MIPTIALYLGAGVTVLGLVALLRPMPRPWVATRVRGAALLVAGLLLAGAALAAPAPEVRVARPVSQLDRFIPVYQFDEHHMVRVRAPPEVALRAVRAVTTDEIRGFRTLTWLRRFGRPGPPSLLDPPAGVPIIDLATRSGFLPLADVSGAAAGELDGWRYELVYGAPSPVTRAARALLAGLPRTPETFRALTAPGFARTAVNFRVTPDGEGGAVVATETRVFATGPSTRRLMAAYWRVIYPGSALIRRSWLAAIRRRAERAARAGERAEGEG